ncbi:MFS transporter [Kibdelosporangium persicum]|uniref:Major facilitator transporter n=1 Tax=Kibdelosporangium persicum TaxID=2698649 RepID=A0ABX2F690_9PSEU|nr:MFS transporter [Kibdelosporangium persicum]NRN66674.1 Major facilitator transporter [Kibdelosporangium persicum]
MRSAIVAVLGVFALNGVVFGSWAPRVPALAAQIGAEEGALGLSLLGASIGMIASALLAGSLCARYGARVMVLISAVAGCVVLPVLGLATSPAQLGLVLFALGVTVGVLDVAMNVAAVTAIRQAGRAMMPVFHAFFSIGGLVGALGAAGAAASQLNPSRHLAVVAVIGVVMAVVFSRRIPVEDLKPNAHQEGPRRSLVKRPVLWLLGFIALCSSVAEGASVDWSAFFGVHERGIGEASAALIYAGFSICMAVARLLGERIETRWGPQRMLIGGSTIGALGLFLAVLVPVPAFTFIGFALAGLGLAYGFPVALELAGAVGRRADGGGGERELGFVTTIAYSGFLLGPPMIGGIASVTSLSVALGVAGVIALAMAPLTLLANRARRREQQQTHQQAVETVGA